MTGVVGNCEVSIPTLGGDEDDYGFVNLFKNFRILKLQQIIDERDQLKWSLPDEMPLDPQGNVQHDDYIAQWQEQSWIYEGIITTLTDEVKAMITPWCETIVLDGIILLFVLIQEYASTMNEALIITYDELRKENLKLSKFGNNVKKMMNHIWGSSWLIQACGKQVSRQTFIIIFEQLTAYKNPDFQWMFSAFYEQ